MGRWCIRPPRPLVMAHRGDRTRAIENTLPAFEAARDLGAECIELDARPCATGELVVFHDSTLARLVGRGERVESLSLSVLRGLRLSRGHRIPTLDEVFDVIGPSMLLDIEIKSDGIGRYNRLADAVIACVRRHDAVERTIVSSFDPFIMLRSRLLAPKLRIGYLFQQRQLGHLARLLRPYAVHPSADLVTRASVEAWRRRGYAIHPWTVDGTYNLRRLQALGVDAVCTNEPAKAPALFENGM